MEDSVTSLRSSGHHLIDIPIPLISSLRSLRSRRTGLLLRFNFAILTGHHRSDCSNDPTGKKRHQSSAVALLSVICSMHWDSNDSSHVPRAISGARFTCHLAINLGKGMAGRHETSMAGMPRSTPGVLGAGKETSPLADPSRPLR